MRGEGEGKERVLCGKLEGLLAEPRVARSSVTKRHYLMRCATTNSHEMNFLILILIGYKQFDP